MKRPLLGWIVAVAASAAAPVFADTDADLKALRDVDVHGEGHDAAQAAWKNIAALDAAEIPIILTAMNDAGPLATNWLRAAVDAIAEQSQAGADSDLVVALEKFTVDSEHSPRPRRLAFEWLTRFAPDKRQPLLDGMLDDPALELRYDAVASVIAAAESATDNDAKRALYQKAINASRDVGQIQACAAALGELDVEIDLVRHLGMITNWHVIGPFDNKDGKGFDAVYPPEESIDLDSTYDGLDARVAWVPLSTEDKLGVFDVNELAGRHKGAADYLYAEFESTEQRPAQLRYGTYNATKAWFNGEEVAAYEVYHAAMDIDQYVADVTLRPGKNSILIKICQNEQTEDWAQTWSIQLRVTDPLGKAIHSTAANQTTKE